MYVIILLISVIGKESEILFLINYYIFIIDYEIEEKCVCLMWFIVQCVGLGL